MGFEWITMGFIGYYFYKLYIKCIDAFSPKVRRALIIKNSESSPVKGYVLITLDGSNWKKAFSYDSNFVKFSVADIVGKTERQLEETKRRVERDLIVKMQMGRLVNDDEGLPKSAVNPVIEEVDV